MQEKPKATYGGKKIQGHQQHFFHTLQCLQLWDAKQAFNCLK